MKKNLFRLLTVLASFMLAFGLGSCKKNGDIKNSDLTITFQNQNSGSDIGLNESFKNADNIDILYETFQFYLSDITLTNVKGKTHLVSEIELFKFNENGFSSIDFRVPFGEYESISFGIGVKKTLNETDPSNFSEEGHPLNITENTYWGWASMYRFIMSEGRFDSDLDGEFEGTFAYHTGLETSYRTYATALDLEVNKKGANALNFNISLDKLLGTSGNEVDVETEPYYHGGAADQDISIRISDNMIGAITVKN